jgi:hypothetical protein
MARSRWIETKDCDVPRQVCEGFDFASARERIKLVGRGKQLKEIAARVDLIVITR